MPGPHRGQGAAHAVRDVELAGASRSLALLLAMTLFPPIVLWLLPTMGCGAH